MGFKISLALPIIRDILETLKGLVSYRKWALKTQRNLSSIVGFFLSSLRY